MSMPLCRLFHTDSETFRKYFLSPENSKLWMSGGIVSMNFVNLFPGSKIANEYLPQNV